MNSLEEFVLAHQYRYYVLGDPVMSDYAYDELERCALRVLPKSSILNAVGIMGSDSADDYPQEIKELAAKMTL